MSDARRAGSEKRVQYAALPYRHVGASRLEVMVITSRSTKRWIIPKGWPKNGLPPHRSAAHEAFEEGGVAGRVSKTAIGSYVYEKQLAEDSIVVCEVHVFPLEVTSEHQTWPEQAERRVLWLAPTEAAKLVDEPQLSALLRSFTMIP